MQDVKALLEQKSSPATTSSHAIGYKPRGFLPTNTFIFHGRETLVKELVQTLTQGLVDGELPRIALLGAGGMGKTSTALAVMAHPDLKMHFIDTNLIWVPCVKANSVSLFLDALYTSLEPSRIRGDVQRTIISELQESGSLVLLLDNFETPWNVTDEHSEVEDILRQISNISHIALFITMWASDPPCDGIPWKLWNIKPTDANASNQIFTEINPSATGDFNLATLLSELGYMPLAITLMARLGKSTKSSVEDFLKNYRTLSTALLSRGTDAQHSMDKCISLSIDSKLMKDCSDALTLLAILSMLPVGTSSITLQKWWASEISNFLVALDTLRDASLVEDRNNTFYILPVICTYMLDSSHFPKQVHALIIKTVCNVLDHYKLSPGDGSFKENTSAIILEEVNLQTILLQVIDSDVTVINALLILACHQTKTKPSTAVIKYALKLAERADQPKLLAKTLTYYGDILHELDKYDQALEQFARAHTIYSSISERVHAVECLLMQVEVHSYAGPDLERSKSIINRAQSEAKTFDNKHCFGRCLYSLGKAYRQAYQYKEAYTYLH